MTDHTQPGSANTADEKNLDRLTALSDGIFAIAMTLLVLDIRVPEGLDTAGFHQLLHDLLPKVGAYALSFAILAGIWRAHRQILRLAERMDGLPLRLTLINLGAIALVPFPTTMLSEYASQPLAVVVYSTTIILIDLLHLAVIYTIRRDGTDPARPASPRLGADIVTDLIATVLVFAATVPIAFASPTAALWTWLVLVPVKTVLRIRRRAGATPDPH